MTDLENLQKQENQMEDAADQRDTDIKQQIFDLWIQLSPLAQEGLLADLVEASEGEEEEELDEDELAFFGEPNA